MLSTLLAVGAPMVTLAQHGHGGGGPGGPHNQNKIGGTVSSLASDGSSFTITGPHGETATVDVSNTTTIKNESDGSTATLANGENVQISGTFDSTGKILTAASIVVDDRKPPRKLQLAQGTILSLNANNTTLVLTVTQANFTTTSTTITVVANANTAFCSSKGKITFADLTAGETIRVAGSFDAATQTLVATRIDVNK